MKSNSYYVSAPYEEFGMTACMDEISIRIKALKEIFGKEFKAKTKQRGGMIWYRIREK